MILAPNYMSNPIRPLTDKEKKRLVIATVGVLGLAGIAVWIARRPGTLLPEKKDYGITVDELCANGVVTDEEKLRRTVEDTYDTQVSGGIRDPFTMATAFFAKIAPHCHVSPRDARSPAEAEFYLTVFVAFLEQLETDGLITDDEARARMFEAMAWASRGGWIPTEQILPVVPGQGEAGG